jgi:hypothetical protein
VHYSQLNSGTTNNGVGVGFSLSYPPNLKSGIFGNHLRLCTAHSLQQSNSGYSTAIGDLEIIIEETNGISTADTQFDLQAAEAVKPNGRKPLQSIIPAWAATLAKETVKFSISQVDPIFGVFSSTAFQLIGGSTYVANSNSILHIRDTPSYIPRSKVRTNPMIQIFDITAALILTHHAPRISGAVDYKITISGETHKMSRSVGPAGVGNPSGSITDSSKFTINWG